jgi:hypothetical protein
MMKMQPKGPEVSELGDLHAAATTIASFTDMQQILYVNTLLCLQQTDQKLPQCNMCRGPIAKNSS